MFPRSCCLILIRCTLDFFGPCGFFEILVKFLCSRLRTLGFKFKRVLHGQPREETKHKNLYIKPWVWLKEDICGLCMGMGWSNWTGSYRGLNPHLSNRLLMKEYLRQSTCPVMTEFGCRACSASFYWITNSEKNGWNSFSPLWYAYG